MKRSPFVVDVSDLLGRDVPPRPVVVEAVVDWRLEMSRILPSHRSSPTSPLDRYPAGSWCEARCATPSNTSVGGVSPTFVDDGCDPVTGLFETNPGEDAYPIEGTIIDLEPFLRDDTLLGLPLLPICNESCEGLVSTAETDLNTDSPGEPDDTGSPFAVLRDLLPPGD